MPVMSSKLQDQIEKGEVVLGGCCVMELAPEFRCNKCKKEFGSSTTVLEADVTSFYFSVGGFHDGYSHLSIVKREDGAEIQYFTGPGGMLEDEGTRENLSNDDWNHFIHRIFQCFITDWKKRYDDPDVLDGTQWELKIEFNSRKAIKIYGSNQYPVYWNKFLKAVKQLHRLRHKQ